METLLESLSSRRAVTTDPWSPGRGDDGVHHGSNLPLLVLEDEKPLQSDGENPPKKECCCDV